MENFESSRDKLALKISEAYGTKEAEATGSICIFLLGCYCKIHKPFLIKAKTEILKLKISCMLMDDLKIQGIDSTSAPNYAVKFNLTCDEMLKSFRIPLPFIYAPQQSTECGNGFVSELVTLCENPKYEKLKQHTRLFPESNSKLPHHDQFVPNFPITNGDDFVVHAMDRAKTEINIMLDILTKERGNENGLA